MSSDDKMFKFVVFFVTTSVITLRSSTFVDFAGSCVIIIKDVHPGNGIFHITMHRSQVIL